MMGVTIFGKRKPQTRIKRVGANYFPQFKTGACSSWEYLLVDIDEHDQSAYHTTDLNEAEKAIDVYLKTGDESNGNISILEYPR